MTEQQKRAFERLGRLEKAYPYYDLATGTFSGKKNGKYYGGIPLFYDSEQGRLYIDPYDTHTLVYGATGSLKTRSIISPSIRVIGYAEESMIINDPKGELYARHAYELDALGYNIIEINLRDPNVGNSWNPLYIPYLFYINNEYDKASEFINDLANTLMLGERSSDDPFWDYSSSDLLFGLISLLFRYCHDHYDYETQIRSINIGNVLELRRVLFGKSGNIKDTLWRYAQVDELVNASLSGSYYAPNDTKNSILSVFDQKMRTFSIKPALLNMLANNDIDVAQIGKEKTCVFLVTPDEKTSYHRLVSLFIKQTYEYLIFTASQNKENKVDRRITYLVDEFSSLPKINDMPAMISAARSRDIRFVLVLQSHAAIKERYRDEAETIVSNCTNWVFFTSRELPLLKELSELCGMQKNHNTPNISVYELQQFSKEKREALLFCGRFKPAIVNTLDISKFGSRQNKFREHDRPMRIERKRLSFELKDELREQYDENLRRQREMEAAQRTRDPDSSHRQFDIDAMVRKIDEKIAALEEEERRERMGKISRDKEQTDAEAGKQAADMSASEASADKKGE